jgi:D-sedoheptulose 7-phosphate isomerase
MQTIDIIDDYLSTLKNTIDNLDKNEIVAFNNLLETTRKKGKRVIIFGNGGSGSTASHFACDINKGVSLNLNRRHKVIPLTDNIATILAYSNDLSYDDVFVEQMKNFIEDGDVVVGISGSGNSKNVIKAIEYANEIGVMTVGWTGYKGGKLKEIAKMSINANVEDMQLSEDIHMMLVHILMKTLQKND